MFQGLVPGDPGTDANPNFILHRRVTSYITLDMALGYTFPKPAPVEAAPAPGYSKDAKDGKAMAEHTSVSTADTSASIWQRLLWDTTLTVGVNNAFDRSPPTVWGAFNDNYDPPLYSIRNRYYNIGLKTTFQTTHHINYPLPARRAQRPPPLVSGPPPGRRCPCRQRQVRSSPHRGGPGAGPMPR